MNYEAFYAVAANIGTTVTVSTVVIILDSAYWWRWVWRNL